MAAESKSYRKKTINHKGKRKGKEKLGQSPQEQQREPDRINDQINTMYTASGRNEA